jgi:hypothetical protein
MCRYDEWMAGTVGTPGALSPELVLVDPRLAAVARASLLERVDTPAAAELVAASVAAAEIEAARRRLVELSVVTPPRPERRLRTTKLVGALATWSLVAVLVAETRAYALFG